MDNVLNAETWLFAEVGQAFYHQNNQFFKVSVRDETPTPCRPQEMNILYDACLDAPIYLPYAVPPEQLSDMLWLEYEKHTTLEFLLDGMDATLDKELRIECIRDVEETCEENLAVYQFVRQRFLSRPLPKEADVTHAIQYAKTSKVKELYQEALADARIVGALQKFKQARTKVAKQFDFKKFVEGAKRKQDVIFKALRHGKTAEARCDLFHYITSATDSGREKGKTISDLVQTFNIVATQARDAQHFDFALRTLEYAELLEEDAFTWTIRAEILKLRNQLEEAGKVYQETIQKFPENVVARTGYAEILKLRNQLEEAGKVYQETIQKFPENVVARNGYAEILKLRNQLEEAGKVYQETIQKFPENVVARTGYAEILKLRNQLEEAGKVYQETIQKFPNDDVARNGYAEILKLRNQLDESGKVYRDTIEKFPNDVVARTGYANLLLRLQQFSEVRELLTAQVARLQTRDDWIGFHVYAMSFVREKKWDEAVDLLKQGVRDAPLGDKNHFRSALAFAQLQQGCWAESLETLQAVAATPEQQPVVEVLEAEIYAEQALAANNEQQQLEYQNLAEQRIKTLQARPSLTVWVQRAVEQLIESYQLLKGKLITAITQAQREAANNAVFDLLMAA